MSYLIDTSWVVAYLRNNRLAQERLQNFESDGLFVSIIVVAELFRGVFASSDPVRGESVLEHFLAGVTVLGIDREIARVFGREDARLRREGNPMGHLDMLIAATALHHNLTLLTADRDFERLEQLQTILL